MKPGMTATEVRSLTYSTYGVPVINLDATQDDILKYGYFGYIDKSLRDQIFDCPYGQLNIFLKCIRMDVKRLKRLIKTGENKND